MILAFIVLTVILIMTVKGFSDPFMLFLAFVTAFELQPGELYPALGFLHIERVLLVLIVAVFFMKKMHFQWPRITRRFLWFYGAMLLSSVFAFWPSNSLQFDLKFLEIVIYHLLLVAMLSTEERIRKYLLLYTGLVAWIGASALYEYHNGVRIFTMNIDRAEGLTSAGGDPNTMAITMVVAMPLAFILLTKGTSKWLKLYGAVIFGIYLTTIIDTGSRTAFLGFVFFLLLIVFHKKRNWKYLPLVLVALPLLWMVIPQEYKARYMTVETRDQDESYTNRLLSWQGGVQMFLHNPLSGIGPDDYTAANGMEYWPGKPRHWLNAHSLYFKLLGELGIVGVFTFFAYLVSLIRMNWLLARRFKKAQFDPIIQQFPYACNLCVYLLLFAGYSSHNTYRQGWFTLGAVTAAIALLKLPTEGSKNPVNPEATRSPAWVSAKKPRKAEVVAV
ncbi:MAG TPA: O-antigen ligase family protein [Silvibacterium sp.]|nr:O-antigen ligase family protein [Silvibacterium sp.]